MIIKPLSKLFKILIKNSIKPIVVGGFIRDALLNIDSKDIDIELYNLDNLQKLELLFENIHFIGKSFGVAKLTYNYYNIDFSLPRIDNKIASGHKGFSIVTNANLSFKEAASRRDFSINALGYDVINKKLLDEFDGLKDLKNRLLRAVDESTFMQDPLRVLRAVRFCATLEFKMDQNLFLLCKKMIANKAIDELPKERIFGEVKKILLEAKKPSIAFALLKKMGYNAFDDRYIDNIKAYFKDKFIVQLALLCDKNIQTITDNKTIIKGVAKLLETSKNLTDNTSELELLKLANSIKLENLLEYNFAKNLITKDSYELFLSKANKYGILHSGIKPLCNGETLINEGLKPSSEFKTILQERYDEQLLLHQLNI